MEAKEVVNFIQFYRHDLLNHLQVIQGYTKLGKLEKADANLSKLFEYLHKERNLLNLNIPHVFLWFLEFRMKYKRYQLSYTIDMENIKLTDADSSIRTKLEQIMLDIDETCRLDTMYRVHVNFKNAGESCLINVSIELGEDNNQSPSQLSEKINITQSENTREYSFKVFTS